jgi:two-component sensor histidine kinase
LIQILRKHQDTATGYAIAGSVFALAIIVRLLIDPYVAIPYVTLFPTMVICSLAGGRISGISAAVIGGFTAWYLWLPPRHSFYLEWPAGHLTVALYVLTSTILLLLTRGLNETLRALEKERDLSADLFRELQHRTANSLQNVSALLRQNRREIESESRKAADVIDMAASRFDIMSQINRRLYNPEMREVVMTAYLEQLCHDILLAIGNDHIAVVVRPSQIALSRERAILVSLLVFELMLNASKHAFTQGEPGSVVISVDREPSGYRLTFSDDGKGLQEGADLTDSAGLGGRIMTGLVGQLGGTMQVRSSPGNTVEISMPANGG